MNKERSNNTDRIAASRKLLEDKEAIIAYSNGEITKEELRERGIKLAMPL